MMPATPGQPFLQRIVTARRADVESARTAIPLADVRRQAEAAPPALSIGAALAAAPGVALIAEMSDERACERGLPSPEWSAQGDNVSDL